MSFKYVALAAALLPIVTLCHGQAYMDDVAKSTCECVGKIPDTTPAGEAKAQVGICILQSLPAYKDKIRVDFGLDLTTSTKMVNASGNSWPPVW